MKLELTDKEALEVFHSALCNGLGWLEGYGLKLEYNPVQYQEVKEKLKQDSPNEIICYEDILMELLKQDGELILIDLEGDEEPAAIKLHDIYERIGTVDPEVLIDEMNGNGDAITSDVILQIIFFGEVMYG